ncbi:hypothetical protein IC784_03035 [Acinetobacter seifertii]|uniref:Uncharacterized protein n=1 Tax=Acinetobacter seifertii TaxID=1530123 RepID=A0A7H2YXF1_9GAMM|nr:hypothetical protein IC795_02905 [Acinetobacter seifertii]QNX49360.1 hypothetical protein IC784_03035 [Acinetobacter seifertii]QNY17785.1 hypothetical protein IC765_03105 [Acinetobacter seifertii]
MLKKRESSEKIIALVYGIYINSSVNWKKILYRQILDIKKLGILDLSDIYLIVSNPESVPQVESYLRQFDFKNIIIYTENKYEYYALHFIWELSRQENSYKYMIYMHTQGMSYAKKRRNKTEEILTYYTLKFWKDYLTIFDKNHHINKIGILPGEGSGFGDEQQQYRNLKGWIWFNFWWARKSYIATLSEPIETSDRYYYEYWLGLQDANCNQNDTYSMYAHQVRFFKSEVAENILMELYEEKRCRFTLQSLLQRFFN